MREEPLTGDAAAIVTQFLAISTQIITLSNICHHQTQEIEYLANLAGVYCLEAFPQFFERSIAINGRPARQNLRPALTVPDRVAHFACG